MGYFNLVNQRQFTGKRTYPYKRAQYNWRRALTKVKAWKAIAHFKRRYPPSSRRLFKKSYTNKGSGRQGAKRGRK